MSWVRFGSRDLLGGMAGMGLALGWWLEYRHDREREAYLNRAENIREYVESVAFPRSDTNVVTVIYTDGTMVEMPYDLPPRRKTP